MSSRVGASKGNAAQNASSHAGSSSRAAMPPPASTEPVTENGKPKKKKHRAGRKRKNRRQSFVAPSETAESTVDGEGGDNGRGGRPGLLGASRANANQASFYRLQQGNRSNTSLESEALLDHREHAPVRSRRDTIKQGLARVAMPFSSSRHVHETAISEDEGDHNTERSPLLGNRNRTRSRPQHSRTNSGFGYGSQSHLGAHTRSSAARRTSNASKTSSRSRRRIDIATTAHNNIEEPHDVNNPPSVPASPAMGPMEEPFLTGANSDRGRDAVVEIEEEEFDLDGRRFSSNSPDALRRRPTGIELAERDVCFPGDDDEEDASHQDEHRDESVRRRRRRGRNWPDLEILEEWSREEKEERTQQEVQRAKKISEPVMVGGRLRPAKTIWHKEEDDAPFRFTYFNETLDGTIHARTISDLQDDMTFKELFLPDPVELSDDSDDEDDNRDDNALERPAFLKRASSDPAMRSERAPSENGTNAPSAATSKTVLDSAPVSGHNTPQPKKKRYGPRPTFWLDVLKPTETEMKVLSKAFGIHQLTSEDILMDEPREKVELFPSYYFVNYRTFEQDRDSEDYMEPINMYVIVFRHGVITFHHSMSPHPANVRRRIRQLNDYMSPTADWISYAIIDDVTDVYAPLVSEIEKEVDSIDEDILYMHTTAADNAEPSKSKAVTKEQHRPKTPQNQADLGAAKAEGEKTAGESGGDMLRKVGECRKKVMSLYRLLGNKADVIKGFAKRCNEHWEVAPRSEIGLYLGDIQDHIVTMTGNLSHFERYAHSELLMSNHTNNFRFTAYYPARMVTTSRRLTSA